MGGLYDALKYLGAFLITPIAAFGLKVELLVRGFRKETPSGNKTTFVEVSNEKRLCCCKLGRNSHSKILKRAERKVYRELDLIKFISQ